MTPLPQSLVPDALRYLREHLADGHTLANGFLHAAPFASGQVGISLPAGLSVSAMADFSSGGKLRRSRGRPIQITTRVGQTFSARLRPSSAGRLVNFIYSYLNGNAERICVFDDILLGPADPISRSDPRMVRFNDEMYCVLAGTANNRNMILQTVRDSDALWYFMCMGTSMPASASFRSTRIFSNEDLRKLIRNVDWCAVGAYDGEGYVLWETGNPVGQVDDGH